MLLPLPAGAVGIGFRWDCNRNRLRQEVLDIGRVLK